MLTYNVRIWLSIFNKGINCENATFWKENVCISNYESPIDAFQNLVILKWLDFRANLCFEWSANISPDI